MLQQIFLVLVMCADAQRIGFNSDIDSSYSESALKTLEMDVPARGRGRKIFNCFTCRLPMAGRAPRRASGGGVASHAQSSQRQAYPATLCHPPQFVDSVRLYWFICLNPYRASNCLHRTEDSCCRFGTISRCPENNDRRYIIPPRIVVMPRVRAHLG